MKRLKATGALLLVGSTLVIAGCEQQVPGVPGNNNEIKLGAGGDDWGDHANCSPKGCPRTGSGSTNRNRGQNSNLKFEPVHLGVVHIDLAASTGAIKSAHALYPLQDCVKELGANAHAQILDSYEVSATWISQGACQSIPQGTGDHFANWMFFDQTKIYIDVDGLRNKFQKVHPIIFTKFGAANLRANRNKNYAFYNAKVMPHSVQSGDELLYVENFFSDKKGNGLRRLKKAGNMNRPVKPRNYSMNIHVVSIWGDEEKGEWTDIVVDPDTGNGSDD